MTIEEKFYEAIDGVFCSIFAPSYSDIIDAIKPIITEQDRIARKEERERCIRAAQKHICDTCGFYRLCKVETSTDVGYYGENGKCLDRVKIREAIEEGGSDGNM